MAAVFGGRSRELRSICLPVKQCSLEGEAEYGAHGDNAASAFCNNSIKSSYILIFAHPLPDSRANPNTCCSLPAQLGSRYFGACFAENYTRTNTKEEESQPWTPKVSSLGLRFKPYECHHFSHAGSLPSPLRLTLRRPSLDPTSPEPEQNPRIPEW